MCKLKSAIILKDRIFMPDYDSHSKMLEKLGITDDYINASKVFVRAELSPENRDVFSDIDGWKFCVDQDITPEWFDEKDCAERMRKAVKEWANTHIFFRQNEIKIYSGENIYVKDCNNVEVFDNVTVDEICGNATIKRIGDSVTVKNICGNATIDNIGGNATAETVCDNATVKYICDNATVTSHSKWNNSASLIIADNAMFRDCYTKTIYYAGGWKFAEVKKGKINTNYDRKEKR